ncbi:hypothetical protein BZB76_1121 [Actinomadura pelletieri DSM 43383]|uniref:Beta/gamma crystallin n=1 Tax=Actinomadura pelletieri DSM 43383 TaxID=1120940 RepID=A0A495R0L2_9ACTN|nr:hypothetical protein [Actinomadura pelletieri]RKS79646.1 hypothetical protein BZB76_1121 [Actinomadura pelletieri DSM 43383]
MTINPTRALLAPALAAACAVSATAALTTAADASTSTPTRAATALSDPTVCKDLKNGRFCIRVKVGDHPQVCYGKHSGEMVRVRLGFQVRGSSGWITRWDDGPFPAYKGRTYCFIFKKQTVSAGHEYRGVLQQVGGPTWVTPAITP